MHMNLNNHIMEWRLHNKNITNMGWLVGARVHELPNLYLKKYVCTCFLCLSLRISHVPSFSNQPKSKQIQYDFVI